MLRLRTIITEKSSDKLHFTRMADGSNGRRPPRPRPNRPMAVWGRSKWLSWPFETSDITWAQTCNPVSNGQWIS